MKEPVHSLIKKPSKILKRKILKCQEQLLVNDLVNNTKRAE